MTLNDKKDSKIIVIMCVDICVIAYVILGLFGMNTFGIILVEKLSHRLSESI